MPIQIVPYDATWPQRFADIRGDLEQALTGVPIRAIEHVGSTSVPGLAAKPIIDVDVVVRQESLEPAIRALEAVGYRHRGDLGIADRHALTEPDDGIRRNVYVIADGSLALRNHLAVRDALRADPTLRFRYAALKARLAAEVGAMDAYVERKTALLTEILAGAGFTDAEVESIRAANRPRR